MSDIQFLCPKCGHNLIVDVAGAGLSVPCPECNETIFIPGHAEQQATQSDDAISGGVMDKPYCAPDNAPRLEEAPDGGRVPKWKAVLKTAVLVVKALLGWLGKAVCLLGWLTIGLFRQVVMVTVLRMRLGLQYRKAGEYAYQHKVVETAGAAIRTQIMAIEAAADASRSGQVEPGLNWLSRMAARRELLFARIVCRIKIRKLFGALGKELVVGEPVDAVLANFTDRTTRTRETTDRMRTMNPNNGGIVNLVVGVAILGVIVCVIYPLLMGKPSDVEAQYRLGLKYAKGDGVKKDETEAVEWFSKAAEQGHTLAQNSLGVCYETGNGVDKNEVIAVQWYRKAAELGYAVAQNNLGAVYAKGRGVAQDDAKAVEWFRKAAEQGNADAQRNLGLMYSDGRGVAKDEKKAVEWSQKAAKHGCVEAQNDLGTLYSEGRGVAQDNAKAVEWFRQAAKKGNAPSQYNLGVAFLEGRGVAQDDAKAVEWFRKAAEQGNVDAQYNLGWMYRNGRGVAKGEKKSLEWFRKAAEQGDAQAQNNLGVSHSKGDGVTKPHPGELVDASVNPKISGADDHSNRVEVQDQLKYPILDYPTPSDIHPAIAIMSEQNAAVMMVTLLALHGSQNLLGDRNRLITYKNATFWAKPQHVSGNVYRVTLSIFDSFDVFGDANVRELSWDVNTATRAVEAKTSLSQLCLEAAHNESAMEKFIVIIQGLGKP